MVSGLQVTGEMWLQELKGAADIWLQPPIFGRRSQDAASGAMCAAVGTTMWLVESRCVCITNSLKVVSRAYVTIYFLSESQ